MLRSLRPIRFIDVVCAFVAVAGISFLAKNVAGTSTQSADPFIGPGTPTPCGSPGTLDTTFNGTGIVVTPIGISYDEADSVAVQSDGKIVAAGESETSGHFDFAVARYNADGSLDTSFNTTGKVVTS